MYAVFKHTYARMRGQMLGWGIGLGLYILLMASFYDTIARLGGLQDLLAQYPKDMLAFFGDAMMAINTPSGYLDLYFFNYMSVILGILVVGSCANLLVGDEERGILDLVLAQPVSRSALFWGRLLGFVAALVTILAVCLLTWAIPAKHYGMELTWLQFVRPFLPLLAELLLFGTLALALSLVLPSARAASATTGGLLVANYMLVGLSNINQDLKDIVAYTPLHFYQGGKAVDSLNWEWLVGLLGVSALLALFAWWRFQRHDIRVGGEGGWHIPLLSLRRKPAVRA